MTESAKTWRPLAGVKVVELARILAGPWAGQTLADLGAEVIKVEAPAGDDTRAWGPYFMERAGKPISSYFVSANRGKMSVTADLGDPEDLAFVRALIAEADVVIENFKVGGLRKFGLDAATLRAAHPGLIYCSITGFGQDGPYAPRAGYDFIIQAMGGIMSLTGEADGEPQKPGVAYADIFTGLYGVIAILAALAERAETGRGRHLDMALFDSQAGVLANQAQTYLSSGKVPNRMGNAHPSLAPYQVFQAADGPLVIAVGNDGQFRRFCRIIGAEAMAEDPAYATNPARIANRAAMVPLLASRVAEWRTVELLAALEAAGVPGGPINTVDQVLADPQIRHRGMVLDTGADKSVRTPIVADGMPTAATRPAPGLGADNAAVRARVARPVDRT
jgi:crotonobetainyl-CoA:carnitine CoA-transferase CaiB-like acyl-CoA transferase